MLLAGCDEPAALHLQMIRLAMVQALRERLQGRPLLSTKRALLDYLTALHADEKIESLRTLFLTDRFYLIADEVMWSGCVSEVSAYPRQIVTRALELGSTAIILVHNHPSGDPTPSAVDRELTRAVSLAGKALSVRVLDHLIIARDGWTSFKNEGLL